MISINCILGHNNYFFQSIKSINEECSVNVIFPSLATSCNWMMRFVGTQFITSFDQCCESNFSSCETRKHENKVIGNWKSTNFTWFDIFSDGPKSS